VATISIISAVVIIISFLIVLLIFFIWELQSSFVRVYFKPNITQNIEEELVYIDLIIENQEPVNIKDCTVSIVSLSRMFHFPNTTDLYDEAIDKDILKWESDYAKEGKHIIPLDSKSEKVRFAVLDKNTHKIKFAYNSRESKDYDINQLFLFKLRLDGMVDAKNIVPKYFDGYLFPKFDVKIASGIKVVHEQLNDGMEKIQQERFQNVLLNPIIAFDSGDWKKDKKIPDGIKNYKIRPAQHMAIKT
jgi:hypothetical protein